MKIPYSLPCPSWKSNIPVCFSTCTNWVSCRDMLATYLRSTTLIFEDDSNNPLWSWKQRLKHFLTSTTSLSECMRWLVLHYMMSEPTSSFSRHVHPLNMEVTMISCTNHTVASRNRHALNSPWTPQGIEALRFFINYIRFAWHPCENRVYWVQSGMKGWIYICLIFLSLVAPTLLMQLLLQTFFAI